VRAETGEQNPGVLRQLADIGRMHHLPVSMT
jgi:hypothetical protein